MTILEDIESEMQHSIAEHKFLMMVDITERITQLGFRFSSPDAMREFFEKRIMFVDKPMQNIIEVWLKSSCGKGGHRIYMTTYLPVLE